MAHPDETIHALPRPVLAKGRSTTFLSLRDVRDVEAYVIDALHRSALPLAENDIHRLVAAGIESVYRLERALPPQQPLLPLLDEVLSSRLAELWRSAQSEADAGFEPDTIAA
jgi:hypothetical protein